MGNAGWGYKDVLKYFKKSENNRIPELAKCNYHSSEGVLTIDSLKYKTPLATAYLAAGRELGYDITDLNGANGTGFMPVQTTLRDGKRCSVTKAFLLPAKSRSNLHISLKSLVTHISINPITKHAFGITFTKNNQTYFVKATKEVIVSAGGIRSPQLLMLSGIGPKEELSKHHIKVISDLKVGENYRDNVGHPGLQFSINASVNFDKGQLEINDIYEYAAKESGAFTSTVFLEAMAMVRSKYAIDRPDIEFHFLSSKQELGEVNSQTSNTSLGIRNDFVKNVYGNLMGQTNFFNIWPLLSNPKSVGSIKLRSCNPMDKPIINGNYLADDDDVRRLVDGFKIAIKLTQTKALQK